MAESQTPSAPASVGKTLPPRANLERLKKQARRRLAVLRRENARAKLADAQRAVAKQYGFKSWRALKAHVDSLRTSAFEQRVKAFFDAVGKGQLDEVRRHLDADPTIIRATSADGGSCLHAAVWSAPTLIELLVERGADLNAKYGGTGHTPISWAVTVGSVEQAQTLAGLGADVDLFCAAGLGRLDDVRRCFDAKGMLIPGSARTGSSRFADDGTRLPRPPETSREIISDALYIAARQGQLQTTRELLRHGPDLTFRAYIGGTPLHWACFIASPEVIALLRDAGADETARDDVFQCTPRAFGICCPASWGISRLVRQQLEWDPSLVNILDGRGTPLWEAARSGEMDVVKILLAAGADPAIGGRNGQTPRDIAAEQKHNAVVRLLDEATASSTKASKGKWKPIMDAAFAGNAHLLEQCLKAGADPNVLSPTNHRHRPLHRAIERKKTSPRGDGHEAVVRALLAGGADPKLRGTHGQHTALQLAAIDSPRFVPLLADRFMPLDFWHACVMLDEKRATMLLKKDASLASTRDENQWSPLHYVAASGLFATDARAGKTQIKMAGMLLDAGADINGTYDYQGGWPIPVLYYACGYHNNPTLTAYLLERGAIPYDNESVYHASDEGHAECLAIIEKHADAGKLAAECTRCLQTQMHWGGTRGAKWLLEHGADPNALHPKFGQSGLHAAARNGASAAVVTLLLKHGGDPRSKNREGLTAIEIARKAGKQRVVEQLQAASKSKKK